MSTTKPTIGFYAKTGSEWACLADFDFVKYGIDDFDVSALEGARACKTGYKDGWEPEADALQEMCEKLAALLNEKECKDLFFVACHQTEEGHRYLEFFGNDMKTINIVKKSDDVVDADAFFATQPDFININAVLGTLVTTADDHTGENAVSGADKDSIQEFGIDLDAVYQDAANNVMDILGSLNDMLASLGDVFSGLGDFPELADLPDLADLDNLDISEESEN